MRSLSTMLCCTRAAHFLMVGGAIAQVINEFSVGISAGAGPYFITSGPDNNLWFAEFGGSRIGRIVPATPGAPPVVACAATRKVHGAATSDLPLR